MISFIPTFDVASTFFKFVVRTGNSPQHSVNITKYLNWNVYNERLCLGGSGLWRNFIKKTYIWDKNVPKGSKNVTQVPKTGFLTLVRKFEKLFHKFKKMSIFLKIWDDDITEYTFPGIFSDFFLLFQGSPFHCFRVSILKTLRAGGIWFLGCLTLSVPWFFLLKLHSNCGSNPLECWNSSSNWYPLKNNCAIDNEKNASTIHACLAHDWLFLASHWIATITARSCSAKIVPDPVVPL